jgi:phage terminase large subunit-like protein
MARRPKPPKPIKADAIQHPHVIAAEAYARDVVKGKIPAGEFVRLACKRHLDDLDRAKSDPDFRFYFDPNAAERVCKFIGLQRLTKGRWAAKGQRFVLQPWQAFMTVALFGWLRRSDGKRRFRRAFVLVPRKNGKSEWAGAIGLYMLLADREFGAEVYSGATSEKQAWHVFGAARQMALREPALSAAAGLTVNASNLHVLGNNSKFEPIIGKPGDGASPSCAIVDEYHEHDTDAQVDAMLTGMGAREQPLLLMVTTAGDNIAGPCYAAQKEAEKVLSGALQGDDLFAVIYGIDKDDDWTSDAALLKANPNAEVSVSLEFLRQQRDIALATPRKAGSFKTKHLNVWVQARAAYYPLQRWIESADPTLRLRDFAGQPCVIGLDLASKVDIACLVAVFKHGRDAKGRERFAVFCRHYLPEETVEAPENEHYQGWRLELGHNGGPAWTDEEKADFIWPEVAPRLEVTDGAIIDFDQILDDVLAFARAFRVDCVAYDPHQATHLVNRLIAEEIPVLEYRPTVLNFSEPMKETEALMRERRLIHDGDPVMTWMVSNVVAREDAKDNVYPRKEAPENKIDGPVALISAFGAMKLTPEPQESVYESRGLIEIEIE